MKQSMSSNHSVCRDVEDIKEIRKQLSHAESGIDDVAFRNCNNICNTILIFQLTFTFIQLQTG